MEEDETSKSTVNLSLEVRASVPSTPPLFQENKQGRGATSTKRSRAPEFHNLSERKRRDRINERMKALQELVPRCNKSDKASMLDEALEYIKSLQLQVQEIISNQYNISCKWIDFVNYFKDRPPSNCENVGGNILGCRGFHSSFRTTQGGMSLNMDVTTTMIIKPGTLVDFIIANQNAKDPFSVDWSKAKQTLKSLRIKVSPRNQEFRITGLSEKNCREKTFELKQRNSKNEKAPF